MRTNDEIEVVATCPLDCQDILAAEMRALGAFSVKTEYMAVSGMVTQEGFYRLHLGLRTASHIIRVIKKCSGSSPVILESQAKRIRWDRMIPKGKTFRVDAVAGDRGEKAMGKNDISKAVRLGLEDACQHWGSFKPAVELKEPDIVVTVLVRQKRATIGIRTSGKALHKRGYKTESHPAPLKETTAAMLLHHAGYNGEQLLWDPMCGSGTIAIEAAMIGLNKSPMIHRKKNEFGFEHLSFFNRGMWRDIADEMRQKKRPELKAPLFASDLSSDFVDMAKRHALSARVEKYINWDEGSIFDTDPPQVPDGLEALMVINPPYGERIDFGEQVAGEKFYRELGHYMKHKMAGWRVFILAAKESPWKSVGLKTTSRKNILNGSIQTVIAEFDIFQGKAR